MDVRTKYGFWLASNLKDSFLIDLAVHLPMLLVRQSRNIQGLLSQTRLDRYRVTAGRSISPSVNDPRALSTHSPKRKAATRTSLG